METVGGLFLKILKFLQNFSLQGGIFLVYYVRTHEKCARSSIG